MKMDHEPNNLIELAKILREKEASQTDGRVYFDRFIESKARARGIPLTGSFELTPFCNLDCKMCYVHLNKTQFDPSKLLSVDTWKGFIKQAYDAGMRNASLTGGECLSYHGFKDLYLYLHSLGIAPGILTNGVLVNDELIRIFKRYPPKRVQVSLYGSSDDAYEAVTGHRVFPIVRKNLLLLRDSGIPVKITITPNAYMRGDVIPLLETAHALNIPTVINANLITPRENTGRELCDLTIDEYVEIYKANSRLNQSEPEALDGVELPEANHAASMHYGLRCGAGRSSFGIKHDGSLCPCVSFDEISFSLFDHSFLDAWKKVNEIAKNYPLPVECGDCVYNDRCLLCIAMHKSAPQKGHCDPRICERTKKLMKAGYIPFFDE